MDDDTLAPFVDALSSGLIVMVLVSIFFMLQTATSLTSAAKQMTLNNINENRYTPIVYHDVKRVDLEAHKFNYLINFKLEPELIELIKLQMIEATKVKFTIYSRDDDKKNTVNLLRLLAYLQLPSTIKVETSMQSTTEVLSTVQWEIE